jgi:hypothetical protein
VMIHLVAQRGIPSLVQARELIQADRRPSGRMSRWKATASRESPTACPGFVSPRTRDPAGMTTCCPLWE